MQEEAHDEDRDRYQDGWNPEGVAEAIHRMLMAARILRDPLFAGASA